MNGGPQLGCTLPVCSRRAIREIEYSSFLAPHEKVNLVLVLKRRKFLTELKATHYSRKVALLQLLGLPFTKRSKRSPLKESRWIQVATNQAILAYVTRYSKSLSPLETGVLYGYPLSAVLAYMGLATRTYIRRSRSSPEALLNQIIHSKDMCEEEYEYSYKLYEDLYATSSMIATEYLLSQTSKL
jgi:hypothetical protein